MSDSSDANAKNTESENGLKLSDRIGLKSIANIESLSLKTINEVLSDASNWIEHFYNVSAGDKKVACKITVQKPETGHFSDSVFDLSRAEDLMGSSPKIKNPDDQPYIFLSDLLNFVEEIRTSIKKNTKVRKPGPGEANFGDELDRLGSVFEWIGVHLVSKKISLEDLKRIENPLMTGRIIGLIDKISRILQPVIGPLDIEKSKADDEKLEEITANESGSNGGSGLPLGGGSSQSSEPDQSGGEEPATDSDKTKPDNNRPDQAPNQPSTPFKISELDSESKLYLQSLSIITINQALTRYFNDDSLAKLGFAPGTRVTFDQLPLDVRQQLMDRAFLQVETQLRTGDFNLKDLISGTSSRISFTNQTALSLLIDIRGMQLLNQAVSSLVNKDKDEAAFQEKLSQNKKEELKEEKLGQRVKNDKNITNTKDAEAKINSMQADSGFVERIEKQLEVIGDKKQLDEKLREHLETIFDKLHPEVRDRLLLNLRSLVDVYIQQGLPPEYLISDPKNFDSSKLKNFFGNDLTPQQLEANKEALASIIVFYWKRKRILWAREFREEFAQERYTPEEAIALAAKHGQLPTKKQLELRKLNNTFGGEVVAEALANPQSDLVKNNKVLSDFVQQQQDLIGKQLTTELAKLGAAEQQATLKVYFEFYMPGVVVQQYSVEVFNQQIVPQISPMDYYMIMANTHSEAGAFNRDKTGMMQQALGSMAGIMAGAGGGGGGGEDGGDNLIKNDLTRKALEWGIRAAAGAASGGASEAAFQALEKAELADQTGIIKWLKEQILNKILDWIQKYWPILLAAAAFAIFGPLIGALAATYAGYKLLQGILGAGAKEQLLGGIEAAKQASQAATAQSALNQNLASSTLASQPGVGVGSGAAAQSASAITHGIGTTSMITAGQAVIATISAATVFTFFYQTSLNSAFLTNFPRNESELTGNTDNQKVSKYAEMTKTAVIKTGCSSPENNGTKCVEPSFPLSIEYTITIKPKEDFAIEVTNIEDTIKFKQSEKGWEEAGQTPPSIPEEKFLDFEYFKKIIEEQGGMSDTPLNPVSGSPTPTPSSEPEPTTTPTPTDGYVVIPAGGSLTFTYTLDDLSADYNHTAITNTIEVDFKYQNSYLSGTDNLITGARVCLGQCGGDAGCWPATGNIWQEPYGPLTHGAPGNTNNSWGDAYDIGCESCSSEALYGPDVYATYDGELCFNSTHGPRGCNEQYGCDYVLTFELNGKTQKLHYAHFQDPNPALSTPGACMPVEAGYRIGIMGRRGVGSGVHLHWGASHEDGDFWWGSNPGFTMFDELAPEADNGNKPAKTNDHVTTCYE